MSSSERPFFKSPTLTQNICLIIIYFVEMEGKTDLVVLNWDEDLIHSELDELKTWPMNTKYISWDRLTSTDELPIGNPKAVLVVNTSLSYTSSLVDRLLRYPGSFPIYVFSGEWPKKWPSSRVQNLSPGMLKPFIKP